MIFVTNRKISEGEELVLNYREGFTTTSREELKDILAFTCVCDNCNAGIFSKVHFTMLENLCINLFDFQDPDSYLCFYCNSPLLHRGPSLICEYCGGRFSALLYMIQDFYVDDILGKC